MTQFLFCEKSSKVFLATLFLLAGLWQAPAAVIEAASGSFLDVSTAVASAALGDTVVIPPGTNSWSGTLTLRGITLQGSGTNSTVIVDESPMTTAGSPLIQIITVNDVLTRVTQIQLKRGVVNTFPYLNYTGCIIVYGPSPLFRIDHCVFSYLTGKPIHVGGGEYGLIDHCTFWMVTQANAIEIHDAGYGDASWAAPSSMGTSNSVFIEDCYINAADMFCAIDVSNGGRCVARNNVFVGAFFNTHGTETGQRYRGSRQVEVYNNQFFWNVGQQYNNFYTVVDMRGGTGVVFSNTANGYQSMSWIRDFRATDNDANFAPWFGATGFKPWDLNGPELLTGTASAASNVLVVAGAGWTSNQWVGCTVFNTKKNLCGVVYANDATTMQFLPSRSTWLQIKFSAGDAFSVHRIYPLLDQPGIGQGDLLTGGVPAAVNLNQTSDPLYFWGNTLYKTNAVLTQVEPAALSFSASVKAGRDFFNAPKTNYTPFIYPHPLAVDVPPFIVVATNTAPPGKPTPPSSLSTHTPGQ